MRNKLIAAGVGLFGYGALWGWAIGGDLLEKKSKEHSETLTDIIKKQSAELRRAEDFFQSIPLSDEELVAIRDGVQESEKSDPTEAEVPMEIEQPAAAVGTTSSGRVAYSDSDDVVNPPIPPGETPAQTAQKLRETIARYTGDEEAHDFESMVLASEQSDKAPPYVISQQEFALEVDAEGEKYDKITVTYYPVDRVIVNEDEETEDDVASLIGWKALSSFGGESDDPDVVFVRNPRLRSDFEVVRDVLNKPPLHVLYGMPKEQFAVQRAAGLIRVRPEDE